MRHLGAVVVALSAAMPAFGGVVFDQPADVPRAAFVDRDTTSNTTAAVFTASAFRGADSFAGGDTAGLGRWSLRDATTGDLDLEESLADAYAIEYSGELTSIGRRGSGGTGIAGAAPAIGTAFLVGLAALVVALRPRH